MPDFLGGIRISELFYQEAVRPILRAAFPFLVHSAALLGPGSEVLGYDTPLSTDHDWGPRLVLFLAEDRYETLAPQIVERLRTTLSRTFHGYSTHFGDADAEGVRLRAETAGPVEHRVTVHTVREYFTAQLGFDPVGGPTPADWLLTPQQTLLELTAGAVYHDGLGALEPVRAQLAYYPRDVWLYLMAAQWQRIAQQESFVGRAGDVGDELGSSLVARSIVQDLMRLSFLIERRYAPYSKWFGTAFRKLRCGPILAPLLADVLQAPNWHERERCLASAYAMLINLHNALGVCEPQEPAVSPYYTRPYLVIHADRVAAALLATIPDPVVRALPLYGAADQFSDCTDLLAYPERRTRLRALYAEPVPPAKR